LISTPATPAPCASAIVDGRERSRKAAVDPVHRSLRRTDEHQPLHGGDMPQRTSSTTKRPELAQAVDSVKEAAQHVRNAMQGKIDEARGAATAELAKVMASALKTTGVAQERVESVLNRAEDRLHKMIAKAQKALDSAVRQAEKRYPSSAAKKSTTKRNGAAKK
jgi:hypothetical protein